MDVIKLAETCHMRNRSYCRSIGDKSQPDWCLLEEDQKKEFIESVQHYIDNPDESPPTCQSEEGNKKNELFIDTINEFRAQIPVTKEAEKEVEPAPEDEPEGVEEGYKPPVNIPDDENAPEPEGDLIRNNTPFLTKWMEVNSQRYDFNDVKELSGDDAGLF